MRKTYPTDLTDAEWNRLKSCFSRSKLRGRPRVHGLREIFNAIFYVVRSGCAWRLLPSGFAPQGMVPYGVAGQVPNMGMPTMGMPNTGMPTTGMPTMGP